jgi:hypothetical protein
MKAKNRQPGWQAAATLGLIMGLGLLGVQGCGCAYNQPSALDLDYGRAVHNNIAQQIVNPEAGQVATPGVGLGPRVAQNVQESYEKSFKAESKKLEMKLVQ